jgi:outer membrane protein assembly factor BamB
MAIQWPMFGFDASHSGRTLYAGPNTGGVNWQANISGSATGIVIASDGTLYVTTDGGMVYAISASGTIVWSTRLAYCALTQAALAADGTVYVGVLLNEIFALNPDGSQRWVFTTADNVTTALTVGADGTIYFGTLHGMLYAVHPTGTQQWTYNTGGAIYATPAVGPAGVLYFSTVDGHVYAVNPDGTQQWVYATGATISSSPTVAADGTIYIASEGNLIYALHPTGTLKWTFTITGTLTTRVNSGVAPAVGADGTIYVGANNGDLYAINPDGTQKWVVTTIGSGTPSSPIIDSNGIIYLATSTGSVIAVKPDGTRKWTSPLPQYAVITPVIGANNALYVTGGTAVQQLGPAHPTVVGTAWPMRSHDAQHTGRSRWSGPLGSAQRWLHEAGTGIYGSAALSADGAILYGCLGGELYALNADGSERWTYTTGVPIYSTPAASSDGTMYVGLSNGELHAVNWDGTPAWVYTAGGAFAYSCPVLDVAGVIYLGASDGKLYAINPDGTLKWTYATGAGIVASPALAADGTVYITSTDGALYAVNPDGTARWSFPALTFNTASPVVDTFGVIYVGGTYDGTLYAVNPDGTQRWACTVQGDVWVEPVVGRDGTLYVITQSGYFYAIQSDGTVGLLTALGAWSAITAPLALGADGTLYASGSDGYVHAVDTATGTERWSSSIGGDSNNWGGVTIGVDGVVYVGNDTGTMYAIGQSSGASLIAPNGGEAWMVGSVRNIRWTTIGAVNTTLRIELWVIYDVVNLDGSVTHVNACDSVIAASVAAGTGSYTWTIPLTQSPATYYHVKLFDTATNQLLAQSAAEFSIVALPTPPSVGTGSGVTAWGVWPMWKHDAQNTGCASTNGPEGIAFVKWSSPEYVVGQAVVIGTDGTIYYSTGTGVRAMDPTDGSTIWTTRLWGTSIPALAADGTIYVAASTGMTVSLSALHPDGAVKWTTVLSSWSGDAPDPPIIDNIGTVYYAIADVGVFALNPVDGTVYWTYPLLATTSSSLAVGIDGNLYVPTSSTTFTLDTVLALHTNGTLAWTWNAPTGVVLTPYCCVGSDGTLYTCGNVMSTETAYIFAISPAGATVWTYTSAGEAWSGNQIGVGSDGSLYVAAPHSFVLNSDGTLKIPASSYAGTQYSLVVDQSGYTFSEGYHSTAVAAYTATGAERWTLPLGGTVSAIASDGTLYVCGYAMLYAIGAPIGVILPPAVVAAKWVSGYINPQFGSLNLVYDDASGNVSFCTAPTPQGVFTAPITVMTAASHCALVIDASNTYIVCAQDATGAILYRYSRDMGATWSTS